MIDKTELFFCQSDLTPYRDEELLNGFNRICDRYIS